MRKTLFLFLLVLYSANGIAAEEQFITTAWKNSDPIYEAIRKMDFVEELRTGTLSKDRFNHYLLQDEVYLRAFAKALQLLLVKLDDPDDIDLIQQEVQATLEFEKALHKQLQPLGIKVQASPTTLAYSNYLIATATLKGKEETLAALLPCYWYYLELGKSLAKTLDKINPYRDWIETYSSPEYEKTVNKMLVLANKLAKEASATTRTEMLIAFETSARYEWYFFDASYSEEVWKP